MNFSLCKIAVAAAACLTLSIFSPGTYAEAGSGPGTAKTAEREWDHADKSLPKISVPRFEGERYEAEVPDTLELAERAT